MSQENNRTDIQMPAPAVLPESWPPQDSPQPVRPVWIPWPIAILLAPLFWLMPKRCGPHFVAAGWQAAIAAHLVWTIYGIACFTMLARNEQVYSPIAWLTGRMPEQLGQSLLPVPTFWQSLQAPLSSLANEAFTANMAIQVIAVAIGWLLAEIGMVVLAAVLMPYITIGERTRYLFARAVRLVLWSSTLLALLGLGVLAIGLFMPASPRPNSATIFWPVTQPLSPGDIFSIPSVVLATSFLGIWALWLFIRGGARYTGPAEGPAWQPQKPQCESCGYRLTGLSVESSCPECGSPVAESLPGRRRLSAFAAAPGLLARLRALPSTATVACLDRSFYQSLKTHGQIALARQFAICMCTIAGGIMALSWLISADLWIRDWLYDWTGWSAWLLTIWIATTLALVSLVGLAALLASRFGRRRMGLLAIGTFYWSAWLLLLILPLSVAPGITFWLDRYERPLTVAAGVGVAAFVILAWISLKAFLAFRRAIRAVRFAND